MAKKLTDEGMKDGPMLFERIILALGRLSEEPMQEVQEFIG